MIDKKTSQNNLNPELNELLVMLEHLIASHADFMSEKDDNDKGLVIAVDGKHGSGKTTFLNLFIDRIEKEVRQGREKGYVYQSDFQRDTAVSFLEPIENSKKSILPIWYDAWQNDDFDDPFLSLVGQISKEVSIDTVELKSIKDIALEIAKRASKVCQKPIDKIMDMMIGIKTEDVIKEYFNLAEEINKKNFDDQVDFYEKLEFKKQKFKSALSTLKADKNSTEIPLKVIFIDDLDRCTPIYAIKVLEKIKHFFSTDNTVFVVAIDKNQLESIVKKVYGNEFDANHYLSRFFDFEIKIPLGAIFFSNIQQKYYPQCNSLAAAAVIEFYDMQPREQVKFYRLLKFLSSTKKSWDLDVYYLLVGLKLMNPTQLDILVNLPSNEIESVEAFIKALNSKKCGNNLNKMQKKSQSEYPIIIPILNLMSLFGQLYGDDKHVENIIKNYVYPIKENNDIKKYLCMLEVKSNEKTLGARELKNLLRLLMHYN